MRYLLAQIALSLGLLLPMWSHFHPSSLLVGAILIVLGCLLYGYCFRFLRLGSFHLTPTPNTGQPLVRAGPYALIRHPMYAASLLIFLGVSIGYGDPLKIPLMLALVAVLIAKAKQEERHLLLLFPDYSDYMRTSWRLLPWVYLVLFTCGQ